MLHRYVTLASPKHFYMASSAWLAWLSVLTALGFVVGLYWGLVYAPPDYQQGEAYRIIYVHVPSAWLSLMAYVVMAGAGMMALVWHVKLAEIAVYECAVLGASFTALALATGMLWGKPMWGTWWQWGDARMLSELILLFLYFGVLGLHNAIANRRKAARVASVLALAGIVNIPIIHYSVEWWNTLHQGPTVTRFDTPAAHSSMLWPLLFMAGVFMLYFATVLLARIRVRILEQETDRQWIEGVRGG